MVAPGEAFEVVEHLAIVARLSKDLAIDDDDGVRAEHQAGDEPPEPVGALARSTASRPASAFSRAIRST